MTQQISYLEHINRENDFHHSEYEEEMRMYRYVRDGDFRAVEEARRVFCAGKQGHLSDEPLTNMKYLFVASMTLVIRFAITGGMASEKAYTSSDYYIQQMDKCKSVEAVRALHEEAVRYFTGYGKSEKGKNLFQDGDAVYGLYFPSSKQCHPRGGYCAKSAKESGLFIVLVQKRDRKDGDGIHYGKQTESVPEHVAWLGPFMRRGQCGLCLFFPELFYQDVSAIHRGHAQEVSGEICAQQALGCHILLRHMETFNMSICCLR